MVIALRICLFNRIPDYCPECGIVTQFHGPHSLTRLKIEAYMNGDICACEHCGVHFQFVDTENIFLATFAQGHNKLEDAFASKEEGPIDTD